jgi:hypothetical protein
LHRKDLKDFKMSSRLKFLLSLFSFTIVLRLLPYVLTNYDAKLDSSVIFYPWNFSPMIAVCLFSGAFMSDRRIRFGLPLLALLVSDLGIWAITGQFFWAFPSDRWAAYVCTGIAVGLGQGLNRQTGTSRAIAALGRGLFSEILFFVVTNFVYFWTQTEAPHTTAGLVACFFAAIPFAKTSFASSMFYSFLLFSPLADRSVAPAQTAEPVMQPVRAS